MSDKSIISIETESEWRKKEKKTEIIKSNPKKDKQILVLDFLNDGIGKTFKTKEFDPNLNDYVNSEAYSIEFKVKFKESEYKFSTGSSRLREILKNLSKSLVGKRIQIQKTGLGMETTYTAKILKE